MSLTLQRRGLIDEYKGYNFRRESMAQDSAGKLIYPHNARFESGPFGDKAILVEEGTTNLLRNGDFENGVVGWGALSPDQRYAVKGYHGGGLLLESNSTNVLPRQNLRLDLKQGDVITGQIKIKATDHSWFNNLAIGYRVDALTIPQIPEKTIDLGDGWKQYFFQKTLESDFLHEDAFGLLSLRGGRIEFIIDEFQLEIKPFATSFTPSVRADEEVIIPTAGLLSPEQGTIEFDIMLLEQPSVVKKHMPLFQDLYIHQVNDFVYLHTGTNRFDTKILSDIWNRLAFTWSGGHVESMVMYLNGDRFPVRYDDERYPNLPNWWEKLEIFSKVGSREGSKLLANLRLSSIARTQEQLAPLDRPPEVDEYTTLYIPFNGPDNVRAARSISI